MKILKFKSFESVEIESLKLNIDNCVDIIETIEELYDFIKVDYGKGFTKKDGGFSDNRTTEDDKIALSVYLYKKGVKANYDLDDVQSMLDVAKYMSNKFKRYCNDIKIKISDLTISLTILFDEVDDAEKFKGKVNRIAKKLETYFKYNVDGRFKFYYRSFSSDIIKNATNSVLKEFKDLASEYLILNINHKISIDGNKISLELSNFKYKNRGMSRVKPVKLEDNQIKSLYDYIIIMSAIDEEDVKTEVIDNKLIITVN